MKLNKGKPLCTKIKLILPNYCFLFTHKTIHLNYYIDFILKQNEIGKPLYTKIKLTIPIRYARSAGNLREKGTEGQRLRNRNEDGALLHVR